MDKRHKIGPMPGKSKSYLITLIKVLEFVRDNSPNKDKLRDWLKQEYPDLQSKRTLIDRFNTIINLGLTTENGQSSLVLSEIGQKFIESKNPEILYRQLDANFTSFQAIVDILKNNSRNVHEIVNLLNEKGFESWRCNQDCYARLCWLEALDYVTKNGQYFTLTSDSNNSVKQEPIAAINNPSTDIAYSLTHRCMQEQIAEIGKKFGLIVETEFPFDGGRLDVVWKWMEKGYPVAVFEVHLHGDLSDALDRLTHAKYKFGNPQLFLITDSNQYQEVVSKVGNSHLDVKESLTVIDCKDISAVLGVQRKFLELFGKIFPRHSLRILFRRRPSDPLLETNAVVNKKRVFFKTSSKTNMKNHPNLKRKTYSLFKP